MYGINQQHVNQYHLQQQNKAPNTQQSAPVNYPISYTLNQNYVEMNPAYQPAPTNIPINYNLNPNYVEMKNQILSKSRTNYVTA